MRKLTKTAAVVASMAVMAMGTTVLAGAATEGWVQSGSNWYYYVDGEKVSDQWVLAGDQWYFVDEEGRMAKDAFVRIDKYDKSSEVLKDSDIHASLGKDDIDDDSDFYYMNSDGTLHMGWKSFKASNIYASPNSDVASTLWYYFGESNGRMYVNEWVESNGEWYALSDNGQMYVEAFVNNDLVEWDDSNYYYMNKDGAWVRGWYKTSKLQAGAAPQVISDEEDTKNVFFKEKDKWVYGDPDTGVVAYKEWKDIKGKYYFFGIEADTNEKKDSDLLIETVLTSDGDALTAGNIDVTKGFVVTGAATNTFDSSSPVINSETGIKLDANSHNKAGENAINRAAMYSNVFIRWRNHEGKQEYFYLGDDGAALAKDWKQLDDDYYIYGNDKGELYYDEVALISGKYYYFDKGGICDYKYLNNTVDYVAVVNPEYKDMSEERDKDADKSWHLEAAEKTYLYETTSDKNIYPGVETKDKLTIAEMKLALAQYNNDNLEEDSSETKVKEQFAKKYYIIDSRKVNVKSMTDQEVILAYTAMIYTEGTNDGFKKDITVYKLRTSAKLTGKVKDVPIINTEQ